MKTYTLSPHCHSNWPMAVWKEFRTLPVESCHTHDCYELMIALKDGGVCFIGGAGYAVSAGTLFICPPQDTHAFTLPVGSEICNIMFQPEVLGIEGRKVLDGIRPGAYRLFGNGQLELFERQFAALERELLEQNEGFRAYTGAMLQLILTGIHRQISNLPDVYGSKPDDQMAKIISCIHARFREKLTLAALSKATGVAQEHINRLFHRETRKTFKQYLLSYRIGKAQELLKTSKLSLTEIASQTGFFDSAHFNRTFLRLVGCQPLSYRRNAKK